MGKSSSFKARVRRRLAAGPLRYIARPLFDGLVGAELALARSRGPAEPAAVDGLTAIIKTFERPHQLQRLVESLRRSFQGLSIIVADDSRRPSQLSGVRTLALPYDSGVAAGRQAALDVVTTGLTWVLDDDFVVHRGTRLKAVLELLAQHAALDLVGGPVLDLPLFSRRGSALEPIYPTSASPRLPLGTRFGEAIVCDKVPNFFVARTDRLRLVGWDKQLKRLEHGDFFTRARGVLTSAFLPGFSCFHAQSPFDRHYMQQREDYAADEELLRQRYSLEP